MAETATRLAVKNEGAKPEPSAPAARRELSPFDRLRSEIDRLFDDFGAGPWRSPFRRDVFHVEPFWRGDIRWGKVPAVDIAEGKQGYEITAELPGIDEKNVEVKYANGMLTIKGEKRDEREEKKENYYLSERTYGSFQRSFSVPEGVDPDKVEASFKSGVLTVKLPKTPEAQKKEKRIEIKRA
jgi:HSP20 family protein